MEDLQRQLEYERSARLQAAEDAEKARRYADAVDRCSIAAFSAANVDALLQLLLPLFAEIATAQAALIGLREGSRLVSRAAVGLERSADDTSSASIDLTPLDDSENATIPRAADALSTGAFGPAGIDTVYRLPLTDGGTLIGAVYLGLRSGQALQQEQAHLLRVLAMRCAAAIVQQTTRATLQQAIVARDEVLAVVAHDLRNPISVITVAANTLHQRLTNASARRPLERIIRGAQRADHLISDLLEVNAIEGGRFAIDKRRIEPAKTILAAIESQQSIAANNSVILASDLSPELPAIEADEERVLEVLENLIGNAVKFSTAGRSVTVGATYRPGEILMSVRDSGCGIPAEQLPHLFDRFWQARKRDRRGAGLGLTICKAIVEAHGGRIWPESTVGIGTTMYFSLPIADADVAATKSAEVASILLVDDRPENLLSLKAILERPDYRLVTASSGEQALSLALREHFSVALLDIAMPGMNGLEVATHLKQLERSRDIPIIFITAFGDDPQEIHRAYSAGGADYLVKPLDVEIVRKKVAVFVDLNRRRAAAELSNNDADQGEQHGNTND
jgi:signal transduction histidine kinase/FixJ family two-component response regulator